MNYLRKITGWIVLSALLMWGCSSGSSENGQPGGQDAGPTSSGLTSFEMEHGIGPVDEAISIGEIDEEMAQTGAQIFKTKCSACHKMSERYVGPALGDIFETRSPAYVMNMILNPDEMVKEHPEAKKMLAQFLTPMPNQNLTRDQARAIVEYLASVKEE